RMDTAVNHRHCSFEDAADDAFLPPHFAFAQLSVGKQTRDFSARAGPARRTVVSFAGTQHEVSTIDPANLGRPKQLDVIDLMSVSARDPVTRQRLANTRREISQRFEIVERQLLSVIVHQKEPVTAPRNISRDGTSIRHEHGDAGEMTITRHVRDLDLAVVVEMRY